MICSKGSLFATMALASLAKIVAADCSGYNGNDPSAKDAYWFQETEIVSKSLDLYDLITCAHRVNSL
jgi:hypothetical protein